MVWIAKICTLSRRDNASFAWTGSILPFVNVQNIYFSSKHFIRLCVKGIKINRGARYGLELPAEYIFYGNEKTIQRVKRTLDDGVDDNMKEKVRCLK